jgi:hypothetical protein
MIPLLRRHPEFSGPKFVSGFFKPFLKPLAIACLIVACDPFNPWGSCGNVPSCSALDYRITFHLSGAPFEQDSDTGTYPIDKYGLWIHIEERYNPEQVACRSVGQRGVAYALSCAPCSGPFLSIDSLYFTTDILIATGDTLKAGYNFANDVELPGLSGGGRSLFMDEHNPIRFRDSLFEIRFTGTIDSVQKSAVRAVRVTNPTMLFQ